MMITSDEVERKYFMSLAPVYLITSSYLMQANLRNANVIAYGFSVFTMLISIWLVIASFVRLPKVAVDYTYQICSGLALITALVFVIGWLGTLTELLNLKASPAYIYVYLGIGLLLYFSIIGFNIYNAFKLTHQNSQR